MKCLFNSFFPAEVVALFTDRSIDFTLVDGSPDLSRRQYDYLSRYLKHPVKHCACVKQVHGSRVVCYTKEENINKKLLQEADGIISNITDMPVAVRTADCLPIFLYDPAKKYFGLLHAGWRSTAQEIAAKAVQTLKNQMGSDPRDILIGFGPAIRSCCYAIKGDLNKIFTENTIDRNGKLYLDLVGVNKTQLISQGIESKNIYDCEICTCCQESFYSYRREGKLAGRHLSLMMLKSADGDG